ncbi:TetR/AcrR family transcriptional regulator [Aureibaculum sp. 2210JD6-5]|uniref:TetR/AcrR family transcriptional regulator n=1 Tax=Aureibaculum sp. 2210JD6-5 TaxID=3103957 RepID=UPI002AACC1BF|nr:TetR/AcrR family transcriptional regulator [Aureibaculum sp. 2210JD6-5]MDY7396117.1 TetR/AcrR family transcriptional regulator [Aureibaculum sp. 2210JD6-5]
MPKIIAKKQDWINLGFKLFAENGISGVVVEKMASKLKVNKSSFYWHFKTKKDFLNEIISFWVSTETEQIIEVTDNVESGKEKFKLLIELAFKKEPHLDFIFFLKRYALKDKNIQTIIDDIDNQRIDYTKSILKEMGYSQKEAQLKSELFYKYLIGYHEMIRYKKQSKNYTTEVSKELNQFIKF